MKKEKRSGQLRRFSLIFLIQVVTLSLMVSSSVKVAAQNPSSTDQKDIPFVQVTEMPIFPGGDVAILKYIANNTVYPEAAKKNKITGKVIVRFIVEKNCSVSEVTILQSVDPLLDAEAVRVIKTLPKFEKPAKNDGKVVRVFYMLPITFDLK